ncbi:hypothetical protein MN116_007990 [Schistosoma mekongi]|uniref:Uncharacterized protein n=1 Tax=Schistosoma mekongi TaxID=38744 RepID=A0AAE2D2G9_SCHME|nr:hypothetical protein MN116_007990 [Schistosoma mekongi]
MISLYDDQNISFYGYLFLVILIISIYVLLYLFPNLGAHLPWSDPARFSNDKSINTRLSEAAEDTISQSTEVQLNKSKKYISCIRKRPIRKTVTATTTVSSTSKTLSTHLSDKSSDSQSSPIYSLCSTELLTVEALQSKNGTVCGDKKKSVVIIEPLTIVNKDVVSTNADTTVTPTIDGSTKISCIGSEITKSSKGKKSYPIHQKSCKIVFESAPSSSSPLSSVTTASALEPDDLHVSSPPSPHPSSVQADAFVTSEISLDIPGNDDNGWLCANMKTNKRRRRNKDVKQSKDKDNNAVEDVTSVDDAKLEGLDLQQHQPPSPQFSSSSKQDKNELCDNSNPEVSENVEPDSSQKSLMVECSTISPLNDVNISLDKEQYSIEQQSSTLDLSICNTTTTTTIKSNDTPDTIHSTSIVTSSKRKRRNTSRKTVTNQNENTNTYNILSNDSTLSSTTTSTTDTTTLDSSIKQNEDDEENGFELIELPNTSSQPPSSSSSSIIESELEIHSTNTVEKVLLPPQPPPDHLSHFPPLIKTDNGDPIAVTMDVELLEGGRHPQANKLLKLALSSSNTNNNNNECKQQQRQPSDDSIGSYNIRNRNVTKRTKARKAD